MGESVDKTIAWVRAPSEVANVVELLERQERQWQRGERVLAEQLLEAMPELANDADAALELIVNEVAIRSALGESPTLAEYQQRFPQLAEMLRIQWEVDRALFSTRTNHATNKKLSEAGQHIGRYQIEAVLGRGGMGVAYRAWDPDLKRFLAVKTLRAADAGEMEIARFRTESEAIARVRHPNIVEVYDVGEEDGQPFFAMEYCAGGSLAERLKTSPLEPREAAHYVEQIAAGIAAAHRQSILHRDLKPANVLLSHDPNREAAAQSTVGKGANTAVKSGASSVEGHGGRSLRGSGSGSGNQPVGPVVCKVTDFGLAKALDADEGQTRSGDVLGTPSYMAPEQAFGRTGSVGPAADVYSLGAILYECLTGRPPFRGATVMDTLEQVRYREPVPVRQLQPKTPLDLETIALKCLQKEPSKRYPSAEAMAEDVRRYLEGRPILARPIRPWQRAWRWCRRNPVVAGLLAAVFVILAAGITGTTTMWLRAVEKTRQAEQSLAESEESLRETHRAVNESFVKISSDHMLNEPSMLELRTKLLSASQGYFERFVAKRRHDPKWRREYAQAVSRLASLAQLTEPDAAVGKWREAVGLWEEVLKQSDNLPQDHFQMAMCLTALGYQEFRLELPGAEADLTAALAHLRQGEPPADLAYFQFSSEASCLSYLADLANTRKDAVRARQLHAEAIDVQRRAVTRFDTPLAKIELGSLLTTQARTMADAGQFDAAAEELLKAGELFEAVAALPCREQVLAKRNLASTAGMLATMRAHSTLLSPELAASEADRMFKNALGMWDTLCREHPTVISHYLGRVDTLRAFAEVLQRQNRLVEAQQRAQAGAELREKLLRQNPANKQFLQDAYDSFRQTGALNLQLFGQATDLAEQHRWGDVQADWLNKMVGLLTARHLAGHVPPELAARIPVLSADRARLLQALGKHDESQREWERAIEFAGPAQRVEFEKERAAPPPP